MEHHKSTKTTVGILKSVNVCFSLGILMAVDCIAADISGRVLNGTTGQPMPGFELYVMKPGPRGMQTVKTLQTDSRGRFNVNDIENIMESPHVLQAEFRGVNYNHTIRPGSESSNIDLTIYENTDSMEDIQVSLPHMMIRREGNSLQIDEVYQIDNNSTPKKSYISPEGSFRFFLPEQMTKLTGVAISSETSSMPVKQTPNENSDDEGYNLTNPIKPGRSQIQVSYEIDYTDEHAHVQKKFYYPLEMFTLFVAPQDIQVASNLLKDAGIQSGFRTLIAESVPLGSEVSIDLSGGSTRSSNRGSSQQGGSRVELVPPGIARYKVLVLFNILVLLAAFVGWRLSAQESKESSKTKNKSKRGGSRAKLLRQRNSILEQIAQLDDRRESKTVHESEYQKKRNSLKHHLIDITHHLESDGSYSLEDNKR